MLTPQEQTEIEQLAESWVRAALAAQRVTLGPRCDIPPKTAKETLARTREALRDYLKEAG